MRRFLLYIILVSWASTAFSQQLNDFLPAALRGNAIAQYNTSKCYANGWGTDKNPHKATHFLRLAAEQQLPQAMEEMAQTLGSTSTLLANYWSRGATPNMGNSYESYDGGCYYGELHSYRRDGYGCYAWDSGTVYSGEWYNDLRYGTGMTSFGGYTHYGSYSDDPNGFGAAIIASPSGHFAEAPGSSIYVGNFANGQPQGLGSLYNSEGKLLYYGDFDKGAPVSTYPTTDNYSSYHWTHEELEGGDSYEGETVRGVRRGFGIYRWADGSLWFGYWNNGVRDGEGLYINANGAMVAGVWANGELQM